MTTELTTVVLVTGDFGLGAIETSTSYENTRLELQIDAATGVNVFTTTYVPTPSSSVVMTSSNAVTAIDISSDIASIVGCQINMTTPVVSGDWVYITATYTHLVSGDWYSTVGVHSSAVEYVAGQTDAHFGIGEGTILYAPTSTYIDQWGTVASMTDNVITFTTVISAADGDTFIKVNSVPEESTTPYTGAGASQADWLRLRHLGIV